MAERLQAPKGTYDVLGEASYLQILKNGYDYLQQTQVYATGGYGPNERFIDINLKTQTLVAFEGTRAVYATLISSGKENDDKEKVK